jgi:ribosomal protein S18 acetylase RimI-like enzyme
MKSKGHIQSFRLFKENLNISDVSDSNIIIKIEEKNKDTYDFISKYLDIIPFDDYISNENLYQVVGRKDNQIIGVRIFRMKDGKIHLNFSAIIENQRNKGINRKLLSVIEKFGIENAVTIITSNVRKSNLPSLKSLLKSGFLINKNYDLSYPDGEKKIPLFKKL